MPTAHDQAMIASIISGMQGTQKTAKGMIRGTRKAAPAPAITNKHFVR